MKFPVQVALAELVPRLPVGPNWWYEVKLDGHRTVLWRETGTVRLQARSGRDVTASWMDIAVAGMELPPGVILDGEAIIVVDGRISFEAAQSRALSSPSRAPRLSEDHPALYIVWDVLALPTGDVRSRPYEYRRGAMLDVLAGLPSPSRIQAVSATDDAEVAEVWSDSLQGTGVEGVVAKLSTSPYRPGRSSSWKKVRHSETVDAEVIGYTGPAARPRTVAVRLPDGRTALSQALGAPLAAQIAGHLAISPASGRGRTDTGEAYMAASPDLVVEVLAGTSRHAVVTVTRLR
ncbi:DNA ligase [Streptomyces sp. TRM68367]|uniref:ATP-dependent DNA ligase n=1 Tax=Streptomyces sp. TRM68367 TaxID=2758415 RepID=UPI00165C042C|nr:DNA ligase [Streptomyces sp. TRM68367]MBC9729670.1 DNA ligase [Streptomyces sp. TRM68367]